MKNISSGFKRPGSLMMFGGKLEEVALLLWA
jgi:hypothetical protein